MMVLFVISVVCFIASFITAAITMRKEEKALLWAISVYVLLFSTILAMYAMVRLF